MFYERPDTEGLYFKAPCAKQLPKLFGLSCRANAPSFFYTIASYTPMRLS